MCFPICYPNQITMTRYSERTLQGKEEERRQKTEIETTEELLAQTGTVLGRVCQRARPTTSNGPARKNPNAMHAPRATEGQMHTPTWCSRCPPHPDLTTTPQVPGPTKARSPDRTAAQADRDASKQDGGDRIAESVHSASRASIPGRPVRHEDSAAQANPALERRFLLLTPALWYQQ